MKKTNNSNLNLSSKANSINYVLTPIISELGKYHEVKDIYDLVAKATENVTGEKTIAKRKELLSGIEKSRNYEQAAGYVCNFCLKGDGLGSLKF